jgi:hypothetical protein
MSVTHLKQELEAIQTEFTKFKEGCATHFKRAYDLENEFMNAFEDANEYVSNGTKALLDLFAKHTELVNTVKQEHDNNKFEEGNFNRVSIIKKQDDTIKTLEIKVAELEMRLANAEKNQARQPVSTVKEEPVLQQIVTPQLAEHQCYARVGKAKYNISKQTPDFMDDFPEGVFTTKTGCVVGLPCANKVAYDTVLFCPEHNTGKFEDIRTEPGSQQAAITQLSEAKPAEQQPVEKKKSTPRKKKEVVAPVTVVPEEPVTVVPEEPVTVVPEEPVTVVPEEPVAVVPEEPVAVVPEEPVTVVPEEPVQKVNIPALNLKFEQEDTLDTQSPPLSPVVDIDTIAQAKHVEPVKEPLQDVQNTTSSVIEPPSFDDIEFYDDPTTGKTYYLDSKSKRIFEIAPNDEIGVFVKQL